MTLRLRLFIPLVLMMFLLPASRAHAHHGPPHDEIDEFADDAFARGFAHPLTGWDHLLAGLAVGVIAWQMGKRRGPVSGAIFVTGVALGGVAGRAGLGVPMLESALTASLLLLGMLMVLGRRLHFRITVPVLVALGFCHGTAHGLEAAGPIGYAAYLAGFCVSTWSLIAGTAAGCAAMKKLLRTGAATRGTAQTRALS